MGGLKIFPAIVEAWAPGMYGGQAVAEILYGQVNPSAKLAITIPHSVGQLQMIYNHKPSQYFHPYAAGKPSTPLYPFGHGLSYTTYKYDDLKLAQKEITKDGTVDVSVKLRIRATVMEWKSCNCISAINSVASPVR